MRSNFSLSPEQRTDARQALLLLGGTSTLTEAVRIYMQGRRAPDRVTLDKALALFIKSRNDAQVRTATIVWYDEFLQVVAAQFGERIIDDITRAEFHGWIRDLERGRASKAAIARASRALWRFCIAHEPAMATQDVTVGLTFIVQADTKDGSQKFLRIAECEKLMKNIPLQFRSAVAIMLFAGVRPEEIAGQLGKPRLIWENVNLEERIIRVPSSVAKTGQTRILENLPETIWKWLQPGNAHEEICQCSPLVLVTNIKQAAGFIDTKKWPQDGLRHSFATYAVALTNDPGKVSLWLGHNGNPTMLYRHYRGLATKADAEKFFALKP
jgi:integrase